MTLPRKVNYDLPPWTTVENRVSWQPDPARAAVLVHDLQHHFVRMFEPAAPVWQSMIRHTTRLLSAARELELPIGYTAQPGNQSPESRGLLTDMWGPGIAAGSENVDVIAEVAPTPADTIFTKHRYSAFARSGFEAWLRDHRRDQLIIVGVYAHIGVLATATDAFMRDIQPFVLSDAVADFSAADHDRALTIVARTCGVVLDTASAVDQLRFSHHHRTEMLSDA